MIAISSGSRSSKLIAEAATAWKLLNGVVCIFKPSGMSLKRTAKVIKYKLCEELNSMKPLPRQDFVSIRRINPGISSSEENDPEEKVINQINDGSGLVQIVKHKSYADHPLVAGKGYNLDDIKLNFASHLGINSSGLAVVGLNGGIPTSNLIRMNKWLKTYIVSGRFGKATDTFFHTGRVLEKATFHNIRRHMIDRILASSQATHQRLAFNAAGIPLESERAYELASQGPVRPQISSAPMLYSMKCIQFDSPNFELELSCVNETEDYLRQFIHDIGFKLRSVAVCTKIRCVKFGPFTLELALLNKHWTLEHFISNMKQTATTLKQFNLYERDPTVDTN